jgi:hypothetical protein
MFTKLLNRHQTHCTKYLSYFNFKIIYCARQAGGKPDALTHKLGGMNDSSNNKMQF